MSVLRTLTHLQGATPYCYWREQPASYNILGEGSKLSGNATEITVSTMGNRETASSVRARRFCKLCILFIEADYSAQP